MTKKISHIEANQTYTIEEDTIIEGNIESGAQVKLKNGSLLHIKGSILEDVSITAMETKPTLDMLIPGLGSLYISGNVKFGSSGAKIKNKRTGTTVIFHTSRTDSSKGSQLLVEGDVSKNVRIQWPGSVTLNGAVGDFVTITSETISANNIGENCVFTANEKINAKLLGKDSKLTSTYASIFLTGTANGCTLKASKEIHAGEVGFLNLITAGEDIYCHSVGVGSQLTSTYNSIEAKSMIGSDSTLKASKYIAVQDIDERCKVTAGETICCNNIGKSSMVVSTYGSIHAKTILDGCKLIKASKSIEAEFIGTGCALKAGEMITCWSLGEKSSLHSEYDSIKTGPVASHCTLIASKEITASSIGSHCRVISGENIYCDSVETLSELQSNYADIIVDGHVGSQSKLKSSNTIQVKSRAPDAIFKTASFIDLSKNEDSEKKSSLSSTTNNSTPHLPPRTDNSDFIVEGRLNGTVLVESTPKYASITIHGDGPTYLKQASVVSRRSSVTVKEKQSSISEKKASKEEFRKHFLASFNRRQESTPGTEDHLRRKKS